jgi:hypothetical protein
MNNTRFILAILSIAIQQISFAQTGQWSLTGNNLTGTEKIGSINNKPLKFFTNNKARITLTGAGNLNINSDQTSIQFPVPGPAPKPMMFMFPSGDFNTNRMVIAHSPSFPNYGLQYNDAAESFDFLGAGSSVLNVNLGARTVNVPFAFNVSGSSTFTGNINASSLNINGGNLGVGTSTPRTPLHVSKGFSGVFPFFDAAFTVESPGNSYLTLLAPNFHETGILFGNPVSNVDGGIIYNNLANTQEMQFRTNGNITRMVLKNNGFLGVRTVSPAVELHLLHSDGEDSHHGLRIENIGANGVNWTLYASNADGALSMFAKTNIVGFFNVSGEYFQLSDARRKKDIEPAPDVLQKVLQLDIKKYHFNDNKTNDKKHYGMIAQEVEKIFPEVVYHKILDSSRKDVYAMNYSAFGVIALKAIQELEKQNEDKDSIIDALEKRMEKIEATINVRSDNSSESSKNILISSASLEQNIPNPFSNSTTIHYTLPDKISSAQIIITNKRGSTIKKINITGAGKGAVNVDASSLISGTYNYALIVDGKMINSKQMVLVK